MSKQSNAAVPDPPTRELPANDREHFQLYKDVREAIVSLPIYFRTETKAATALKRLKQRVQKATDIPSPKAQSALAILEELERLLDLRG